MSDEMIAPLSKGQAEMIGTVTAEMTRLRDKLTVILSTVMAGQDVESGEIVSMELNHGNPHITYRINTGDTTNASIEER